jgi:hypothetical protein
MHILQSSIYNDRLKTSISSLKLQGNSKQHAMLVAEAQTEWSSKLPSWTTWSTPSQRRIEHKPAWTECVTSKSPEVSRYQCDKRYEVTATAIISSSTSESGNTRYNLRSCEIEFLQLAHVKEPLRVSRVNWSTSSTDRARVTSLASHAWSMIFRRLFRSA